MSLPGSEILVQGICALAPGGLSQQVVGLLPGVLSQGEKGLGAAGREFTEEEDQAADEEHQGGGPQ